MDKNKKKALESAGWRVGDAKDFLGLTDEESRLIDLRIAIGRRIRELRAKNHLTQQQLAAKLKSSQPRVARIESADVGVSLDLMFRGLFAAGGTLADVSAFAGQDKARPARPAAKSKVKKDVEMIIESDRG